MFKVCNHYPQSPEENKIKCYVFHSCNDFFRKFTLVFNGRAPRLWFNKIKVKCDLRKLKILRSNRHFPLECHHQFASRASLAPNFESELAFWCPFDASSSIRSFYLNREFRPAYKCSWDLNCELHFPSWFPRNISSLCFLLLKMRKIFHGFSKKI